MQALSRALRAAPVSRSAAPWRAARPARLAVAACAPAAAPEAGAGGDAPKEDKPPPPPLSLEDGVGKLDIRVGKITAVEKHPDADSLYVETVDMGEEEPRTIVSGLVKYCNEDELLGRNVLVLANLKPRNMRGIKSFGMLLCASNEEHTVVEPLTPPEGAEMGERLNFCGSEGGDPEPAGGNQLQKKKIWERSQPDFATNADGAPNFRGIAFTTSAGPVCNTKIANGSIS